MSYQKPVQQQYPLSYDGDMPFTPMNEAIVNSSVPFPEIKHGYTSTQFYAGHGIAYMPIYPVEYLASSGEVWYYTDITVEITTQPTEKAQNSYQNLFKSNSTVNERLEKLIDNPTDIPLYGAERNTRDDDDYDYLIITNEDLADNFQPLADYKTQCGIETQIHTVEDIYENYTGVDNAEKIRNFILWYNGSRRCFFIRRGKKNFKRI